MPTPITDYKQFQPDMGFSQSGSKGANRTRLLIRGAEGTVAAFTPGQFRKVMMANNPEYVSLYSDFFQLDAQFNSDVNGTGAAIAVGTLPTGSLNLTSGSANANEHAALGFDFLAWTAANLLVFEASVKQTTNTATRIIQVGLTDDATETSGLAFSTISTSPVAVADDAVMFGYASTGSANYIALSAKATVAQGVSTGVAPSASAYQKLAIVINASQTAFFYIDGVLVATITNAVTAATPLTPYVAITTTTAAAKIMSIDYLYLASLR